MIESVSIDYHWDWSAGYARNTTRLRPLRLVAEVTDLQLLLAQKTIKVFEQQASTAAPAVYRGVGFTSPLLLQLGCPVPADQSSNSWNICPAQPSLAGASSPAL